MNAGNKHDSNRIDRSSPLLILLIVISAVLLALGWLTWQTTWFAGLVSAEQAPQAALRLLALACAVALLAAGLTTWQQRRAQRRLIGQTGETHQARELLAEAFAVSPDGFILFDENDVIVLRNDAVDVVYGRFAEAIQVGNKFEDIVYHGLKHNLYRDIDKSEQTREQFIAERIAMHRSGDAEFMYHGTDDRWVRVIERRSDTGYIVSVATELTRMKHTEEALRANEARYRGILEDHNEFIVRFAPNLEVLYANPAYAAHIGRSQAELNRARLADVIPASALADLEFAMQSVSVERPSGSRDLSVRAPDGQERWESWTLRGFFDEHGNAVEFQAIGRDMSQQKMANDALVNSARLFRSIAEAHPIPVILGRVADNKLVYANEASVPLLGPSIEEILSQPAFDYFVDRSAHDRFDAVMREHGATRNFSARIRSTDGKVFTAELHARLTKYDDELVAAVSVTDTSEIIRTQEQLAEQRLALAQSEKLSALGSLLASVSHELNNPLAIVVGQSQLLEATASDSQTRERAEKIGNAAKRSARIVKTFLSMVRQKPPTRSAVNLNDSIHKSLEIATYGLKTSGIDLTLELDENLPAIEADEDQLIQVVVNLMINAQHAMQEHDGERHLRVVTSLPDDQSVRLVVEDSGPGIALENREKVFDAFFTTKLDGLGTGIGLSVSSGIIRTHGGKITVGESGLGGALFQVDLPRQAGKSVAPEPVTRQPAPAAGEQNRILIIDDEPEVATTISEFLGMDGYTCVSAPTGEAGLSLLGSDHFDLVISDLWMPGIDGPTILRHIIDEQLHPADRILFITGDALSPAAKDFITQSDQPVMEKPFQPDELRQVVSNILSGEVVDGGPKVH